MLPLLQAQGPNPFIGLLPMVAIFVIFFFLIIRPQRKKEAARKALIADVKKNDKVITIGGIHATVAQVDETSVLVQVDTNTKLRIEKSAIGQIVQS